MTTTGKRHASGDRHAGDWRVIGGALLRGMLLGIVAVVSVVLLLLVLSVANGFLLLALLGRVFGNMGGLVGLGVAALCALGVVVALVVGSVRVARHWLDTRDRTPRSRVGFALGALGTIVLVLVVTPASVLDSARGLATGTSQTDRATPVDAAQAERLKVDLPARIARGDVAAITELGLATFHGNGVTLDRDEGVALLRHAAALPDGIEARLVLAVNRQVGHVPALGRTQSNDDVAAQAAALQAAATGLPAAWQPVRLATLSSVQSGSYRSDGDDEQAVRDAMHAAGLAGSRTLAVRGAMFDEGRAVRATREHAGRGSDHDWLRALQGHERAGNLYEVRRLRALSLPVALRNAPATAPVVMPAPDAATLARMARLRTALRNPRETSGGIRLAHAIDDYLQDFIPPPTAVTESRRQAARSGVIDAAERWQLARIHAHGDCMSALDLSDAAYMRAPRDARRPPIDIAWAQAWARRATACASNEADQRRARISLQNLVAMGHMAHVSPDALAATDSDLARMLEGLAR